MKKEGNMDVSEELREAGDVGTRPERLEELSRHGEREVRRAVAGNANTPWEVLERLAYDFPREFFGNPVGVLQMIGRPEEMFSRCITIEEYEDFANRLLQGEDVPEVWVQWFRQHEMFGKCESVKMHVRVAGEMVVGGEYLEVRRLLAQWQHIPQKELRLFVRDNVPRIRRMAVANRALPMDLFMELAQDSDAMIRGEIAKHVCVPEEVLDVLAHDDALGVRVNVAGNKRASVRAVALLVDDMHSAVRRRVAGHPEASDEMLRRLACDQDEVVSAEVGGNQRTPMDVLEVLRHDSDRVVVENALSMIARKEETPVNTLVELAVHTSEDVRKQVAGNVNTPENILCGFVQDREVEVRWQVVLHPRLPLEELEKLEHDEDEGVRRRAIQMRVLRGHPVTCAWDMRRHCEMDDYYNEQETMEYLDWVDGLELPGELKEALQLLLLLPGEDQELCGLLQRRTLPEFILRHYARDVLWRNRLYVGMHAGTPEDVREELKRDGNRAVRAAARGI